MCIRDSPPESYALPPATAKVQIFYGSVFNEVELARHRAIISETAGEVVGIVPATRQNAARDTACLLYTSSTIGANGTRTREERRFLIETIPHLTELGVLIYIIPYYRLTPDIARVLCLSLIHI